MARAIGCSFLAGATYPGCSKKAHASCSCFCHDTVGVRVPDNPTARALLRSAGPMAVTSANISGAPSPSTAEQVFAQLNGRIELILDGGKTQGGVASTVVDCTKVEPAILRVGPISLTEIKSALAWRDYDNNRKL